jgi:hypothetical protein
VIGVWSASEESSLAELPLSVRPAAGPAGAIAVVAAADWTARAHAAVEDGARGLLIAEPAVVEPTAVAGLSDACRRRGIPVVVERARLQVGRPEAAAAHAVIAECAALEDEIGDVLRDTAGWMRRLAGDGLELVEADGSPRGWIGLAAAGPVTASVLVDVLTGVDPGGYLRVVALGVERVEVEIDAAARTGGITVGAQSGVLRLPAAFETPRRAALRRLLQHLEDGTLPPELAELGADETLSRAILAHHRI